MHSSQRVQRILLLLLGLWTAGIVLAPLLSAAGSSAGSVLYSLYQPVCHQFDHRSFHLAGEKLAVCIRCSSIYIAFFLSSVLIVLRKQNGMVAIPSKGWIVAALLPMAADAIFSFLTGYESSTLSRAVTGGLSGLILPWALLPLLTEAIIQLRSRSITKEGSPYVRETQ